MMDARFDALLTEFARAAAPEPTDLVASLQSLPEHGTLPSPWETWTLIGLSRHRERQFWVADVIRTQLRGYPEGVAEFGPAPWMPEWEYYFHWRGCCISRKVDGDAIDVDSYGDTTEYFDTYFCKNYLESLCLNRRNRSRLSTIHPAAGE